jgi:hypothetical protein
MKYAYTVLVGRIQATKKLGPPRGRSKDNIKVTFRKIEIKLSPDQNETETSSFFWAYLSRFHLKTETESSLRNVLFLNKRHDDG